MKKILALLIVSVLILSTCIMGVGTVAFAAEESPEADFMIFDGVLEEYVGAGGDVVIPVSLGIVEIASKAFYYNEDVTSVIIPEGVETIGDRAFQGCKNIEKITLPYSLTKIGGNTFSLCESITEITIPGQLEIIPTWAFSSCIGLKKVIFSYGVREIHNQAFCSLNGLKKVIFPETVEIIACGAFNCQMDKTEVEYVICNPDCELGLFNKTYKGNMDHEWEPDVYQTPFQCSYGVVTYKITVPENSAVAKFLEEKGEQMFNYDETNHKDKFRINAKPASYFDELAENQEDYGITSAPKTEEGTGANTVLPEEKPNNGTEGSENNTTNNNSNNSSNNNANGSNAAGASADNSVTITIIISVVALVALIIICVMVVVILYATGKLGGKKKKKAKAKTEEEIRAEVLKELEAEKVAKEATEKADENIAE